MYVGRSQGGISRFQVPHGWWPPVRAVEGQRPGLGVSGQVALSWHGPAADGRPGGWLTAEADPETVTRHGDHGNAYL